MIEAHVEIASRKVNDHLAIAMRGCGDGHRARARRARLPHPSLPDTRGYLARSIDVNNLHVRALGKVLVRLETGADLSDARRITEYHGVRIAHRDRHERDSIRDLLRADGDLAQLLLDLAVVVDTGAHGERADGHVDLARARLGGKPCGGDAGAVSRELRARPVDVPDRDVDRRRRPRQDLEDTIGALREG